jgi:hypothetical protein
MLVVEALMLAKLEVDVEVEVAKLENGVNVVIPTTGKVGPVLVPGTLLLPVLLPVDGSFDLSLLTHLLLTQELPI